MTKQELIKALKTDKARRAYAENDYNWKVVGDAALTPDGDNLLFFMEKLKGFRIYRLCGFMEGFHNSYPDHFDPMFTFAERRGYCLLDDLRSSAKLSAAMKAEMDSWEEGK